MKRTFALFVLAGALSCSSGGSEPPTDDVEGPSAGNPPPTADDARKRPPTREEAEAILDRIVALFQDHAAAANPAGTHKLVRDLDWNKEEANAHAELNPGDDWKIYSSKGWLTIKSMTTEVFALTLCHETGHLVGGFPFKTSETADSEGALGTTMAAEQQADYFATKDCLPRLWADETEVNAAAFAELGPSERERCEAQYSDLASQQICGRILLASVQTGRLYEEQYAAQFAKDIVYPRFDTPDTSQTMRTREGRVESQCRFDTLVAGALCNVKAKGTEIPGWVPPYGEYSPESEEAAHSSACETGPGARPKCWFHPGSTTTDCSQLGEQECVVENGQHSIRYCDTTDGVSRFACLVNEVCEKDADGIANCIPAQE